MFVLYSIPFEYAVKFSLILRLNLFYFLQRTPIAGHSCPEGHFIGMDSGAGTEDGKGGKGVVMAVVEEVPDGKKGIGLVRSRPVTCR